MSNAFMEWHEYEYSCYEYEYSCYTIGEGNPVICPLFPHDFSCPKYTSMQLNKLSQGSTVVLQSMEAAFMVQYYVCSCNINSDNCTEHY